MNVHFVQYLFKIVQRKLFSIIVNQTLCVVYIMFDAFLMQWWGMHKWSVSHCQQRESVQDPALPPCWSGQTGWSLSAVEMLQGDAAQGPGEEGHNRKRTIQNGLKVSPRKVSTTSSNLNLLLRCQMRSRACSSPSADLLFLPRRLTQRNVSTGDWTSAAGCGTWITTGKWRRSTSSGRWNWWHLVTLMD